MYLFSAYLNTVCGLYSAIENAIFYYFGIVPPQERGSENSETKLRYGLSPHYRAARVNDDQDAALRGYAAADKVRDDIC
ncbi:MAG: hypothetical protein KIT00_00270 [Rhodospirillales bacterium]|nr:hypothetical protein [Rhodospirillales bacterium]